MLFIIFLITRIYLIYTSASQLFSNSLKSKAITDFYHSTNHNFQFQHLKHKTKAAFLHKRSCLSENLSWTASLWDSANLRPSLTSGSVPWHMDQPLGWYSSANMYLLRKCFYAICLVKFIHKCEMTLIKYNTFYK